MTNSTMSDTEQPLSIGKDISRAENNKHFLQDSKSPFKDSSLGAGAWLNLAHHSVSGNNQLCRLEGNIIIKCPPTFFFLFLMKGSHETY